MTTFEAGRPPVYRRRDNGRFNQKQGQIYLIVTVVFFFAFFFYRVGVVLTNRHVVPYNLWALLRYRAHINVEIVSSIKAIKYDKSAPLSPDFFSDTSSSMSTKVATVFASS